MRGRVSAVNSMFVGSSNELGALKVVLLQINGNSYGSCFWRKHDAYNSGVTGIISPSLEN
jgi:hypothetical protein